jgi:hypothetical protein
MVRAVILGKGGSVSKSSVHRNGAPRELEEVASVVAGLVPDDAIFVTRQTFQGNGVGLEEILKLRRSLHHVLPRYVTLLEDVKKRGVWVYRRPDAARSRAIGAVKEAEIRSRPVGR